MNEIEEILKLSPPLLLIVALGCFGKVIKNIPKVPNWLIPVILPFAGAATYSLIGPAYPLPWIAKVQYPFVVYGMIGFICGSTTVGFHQVWSQWIGRNDNSTTPQVPPAT